MIRIGSTDHINREFTSEESEEMIPIWHKLTKKASDRAMEAVTYYGRIEKTDPEWDFLAKEINEHIQNWALKIRRLGGEPRTLWTVAWNEEGEERIWKLESGFYSLPVDFT